MLGGRTVTVPGPKRSPNSPAVSVDLAVSGVSGNTARNPEEVKDLDPDADDLLGNAKLATPDATQNELQRGPSKTGDAHPGAAPSGDLSLGLSQANGAQPTDADIDRAMAERETLQFQQAATAIRQAIQSAPELKELAQNLLIDQTPEGLRIQLVDQDRQSMFPLGSDQLYPKTRALMSLVAQIVAKLPNKLSISGHTDATPYAPSSGYHNWDLATDRANASRRALVAAGVDEGRIVDVVGRADRDPLVRDNPTSPINRRISIVLLRQAKLRAPATTASTAPVTPPAAPGAPAPAPTVAPPPTLTPTRAAAAQSTLSASAPAATPASTKPLAAP